MNGGRLIELETIFFIMVNNEFPEIGEKGTKLGCMFWERLEI